MTTTAYYPNVAHLSKLASVGEPGPGQVAAVLERARRAEGLALEEAALLLAVTDSETLQAIFQAAHEVKTKIWGSRVRLFAPLYLTNDCHNNCTYCGFRRDNELLERRTLSLEEALVDGRYLEDQGFQRILLVCADVSKLSYLDDVLRIMETLYEQTNLRTINLNIAPPSVARLRRFREAGAAMYQSFQETYHPDVYRCVHPGGRKKVFCWRLASMERALEAGFTLLGMGTLLSLSPHRYDVLALIDHAHYLIDRYGVTPAVINVPRLRPALGALLTESSHTVNDEALKQIIAVCRLAMPKASIAVSTREPAALREETLFVGASQLSAGSRTDPGGYHEVEHDQAEQFVLQDERPLGMVVESLLSLGFLPDLHAPLSRGNGGRDPYALPAAVTSPGVDNQAKALLVLAEYLQQRASASTIALDVNSLRSHISTLPSSTLRTFFERRLMELSVFGRKD